MGLFGMAMQAIDREKERAMEATASLRETIEKEPLKYSWELTFRALKSASSLSRRSAITQAFAKKVRETEDTNDLYDAFIGAYKMANRTGNMYARNMAQMLGKRLVYLDDNRVREPDESNIIEPTDSWY